MINESQKKLHWWILAILAFIMPCPGIASQSSGLKGFKVNDHTLLRREFPPFFDSIPRILIPIGGQAGEADNLIGVGCENGYFYIISPGPNRYFISQLRICSSPIESIIPITIGDDGKPYFLMSSPGELHLVHWDGVSLHKEYTKTTESTLRLINGEDLGVSYAFDNQWIYRVIISDDGLLSLMKIYSANDGIKEISYSKAANKLIARLNSSIISIDAHGKNAARNLARLGGVPNCDLKKVVTNFISSRWHRIKPHDLMIERGDSSIYYFRDYSKEDSCWVIRKINITKEKLSFPDKWEIKLEERPLDMLAHGNELFIGAGTITSDLERSKAYLYKLDAITGQVKTRSELYQPPVFLADWGEGIAALCFRLHIILFNYDLDQLGIDHSSLFPTALMIADINNDGTGDVITSGERYFQFNQYLIDNLKKYFSLSFDREEMAEGQKIILRSAVNCYLNQYGRLKDSASEEMALGEAALRNRDYYSSWDHYARARGLFATLKNIREVGKLNSIMILVSRTDRFSSILPFLFLISIAFGGSLALFPRSYATTKLLLGILFLLIIAKFINVIGSLKYYPPLGFILGFSGASLVLYCRSCFVLNQVSNIYKNILINNEAFTHGGGGSRILNSLKLLLGNASSMSGRENEFLELIEKRRASFMETCVPRILELDELAKRLPLIKPPGINLSSCIEASKSSLRAILEDQSRFIELSRSAYDKVAHCEDELNKFSEWLKRYPACDLPTVTKKIWTKQPIGVKDRFIFSISIKKRDSIAFIPEVDWVFILDNIYRNAAANLKNERSPEIAIEIKPGFNYITFTYRDNGPGFSKETVNNILSSVRKTDGHGRGLSISAERIKRYGGSMNIVPSSSGAVIVIKLQKFGSRRNRRYV